MVEAAILLTAISGVGAGAAGTAAVFSAMYPEEVRTRYAPEKRPVSDPLACDFREAVGLPKDSRGTFLPTNQRDVQRAVRKANLWWHPDKHPLNNEASFRNFGKVQEVMLDAEWRKDYEADVEREKRVKEKKADKTKSAVQGIDWEEFNERFLDALNDKKTIRAARQQANQDDAESDVGVSLCQVFLDASGSMSTKLNAATRIDRAKVLFRNIYPRLQESATNVYLIGEPGDTKNASRIIFTGSLDDDDFADDNMLNSWQPRAKSTFLWEYIFTKVQRSVENHPLQELLIVTDGVDNQSQTAFKGLEGFQELTRLMSGKIRVSLLLIGGDLTVEQRQKYRDLCLATGGVFHHECETSTDLAALEFVASLLLPEGSRNLLALKNKKTYAALLDAGEAIKIQGFLPLEDHVPAPSPSEASNARCASNENSPARTSAQNGQKATEAGCSVQ